MALPIEIAGGGLKEAVPLSNTRNFSKKGIPQINLKAWKSQDVTLI